MMSYRYDRKKKKGNTWYVVGTLLIITIIFTPLPRILFDVIERPLEKAWQESQKNKEELKGVIHQFYAKSKFIEEQEKLQDEVDLLTTDLLRTKYLESILASYQTFRDENQTAIVADVVRKPPYASPGTLIVNKGEDDGVIVGNEVITKDHLSLGTISEVYDTTARVLLYTKAQQETAAVRYPEGESFTLIGHGDGYRAEIERGSEVAQGDVVYSQFTPGRILAVVQTVIFDPRDPFKQVYLSLPINLNHIQTVGIIPASTVKLSVDTKEESTEESTN